MRLTRRALLGSAAAGALAAAGVYELVDKLADSPSRPAAGPAPPEQHLLDGIGVVVDNDVEVLVPPLHHQIVTATLAVSPRPADLTEAAETFESAIRQLESRYDRTPAGLGITVAWGMPYFDRYVPRQAARHLPVDERATAAQGRPFAHSPTRSASPAIRPGHVSRRTTSPCSCGATARPHRGRSEDAVHGARRHLPRHEHSQGIRRRRVRTARRACRSTWRRPPGVPGADLIPDTAELFLGFTSTQKAGLGPARIANFETLGFVDLGSTGTSPTARACISRTCTRTSRRGT